MFKNYLTIAFRNLKRQKGYSFINITGLAIGMACFILMFLYVHHEWSYDRFHKNHDRIYRMTYSGQMGGMLFSGSLTPPGMGPELLRTFPGIENMVRITSKGRNFISAGGKSFYEERFHLADASIFSIFDFPLAKGNPESVLKDPHSIVITEKTATKYFGNEDPIGKTLSYDNQHLFTVTGIMNNLPQNSHIQLDFLASFKAIEFVEDFDHTGEIIDQIAYTYLLFSTHFSPEALRQQLPEFVESFMGEGWFNFIKPKIELEALDDIHLHTKEIYDFTVPGDATQVLIFMIIGMLILLIACINHINLSTARYVRRAKEVGVRKVIGSTRKQIQVQFLGESLFFICLSLILAVTLVEIILPVFNGMVDRQISLSDLGYAIFFPGTVGLIFLVVIFAGGYPAFFFSSLNPLTLFRPKAKSSGLNQNVRRFLVVFQFIISIILIIVTLITASQLRFMKNKKLGFNPEQIVVISFPETIEVLRAKTIKQEMLKYTNIISATVSSSVPTRRIGICSFQWEGQEDPNDNTITAIAGDYDFIKTYGLNIKSGRNFDPARITDFHEAYIINEAALGRVNWKNPFGKRFRIAGPDEGAKGSVIGVVEDFHFQSFHHQIKPIIIYPISDKCRYLSLRLKTDGIANTLQWIQKQWQDFSFHRPFEYFFIDEAFARLYGAEEKLMHLFSYFSLLAILIACMGIFGLAAFTVEQRTKEIGIRKVLGASLSGLVSLLTKEFTQWVLIANIIAWPVAYFAMNKWLQNFAYRINIGWWIFVLAGGIALIIALLTVSWQAIRAALANPVESLRYE